LCEKGGFLYAAAMQIAWFLHSRGWAYRYSGGNTAMQLVVAFSRPCADTHWHFDL
jgi:hypothetical protein